MSGACPSRPTGLSAVTLRHPHPPTPSHHPRAAIFGPRAECSFGMPSKPFASIDVSACRHQSTSTVNKHTPPSSLLVHVRPRPSPRSTCSPEMPRCLLSRARRAPVRSHAVQDGTGAPPRQHQHQHPRRRRQQARAGHPEHLLPPTTTAPPATAIHRRSLTATQARPGVAHALHISDGSGSLSTSSLALPCCPVHRLPHSWYTRHAVY